MTETTINLRAGDVVCYEPETRWCHDGWAIARSRGDSIDLVDTYWSDRVVRPAEFELVFNLNDYRRVSRSEWETYAEADRQAIPEHAGYHTSRFVRLGAEPDLATQIANAEEEVRETEERIKSLQWSLERRRQELDDLRALAMKDGYNLVGNPYPELCDEWGDR